MPKLGNFNVQIFVEVVQITFVLQVAVPVYLLNVLMVSSNVLLPSSG